MREPLHRIWGLVIKEFLQLGRDKLLLGFVLLGPLLELLLMGGLAGGGVQNLPLAVVDLDRPAGPDGRVARKDVWGQRRSGAGMDAEWTDQGHRRAAPRLRRGVD
jgi:hypothetical protein